MKPGLPFKVIAQVFLAAVVIYVLSFYLIEHWRTRSGPWQVTFAGDGAGGHPLLTIDEPQLRITNVRISFSAHSALATNAVLIFDRPRDVPFEVPFGQCVFLDLISQPGTVTLKMFDHEIQLLPRVLTIDKVEQPWKSGASIQLPN